MACHHQLCTILINKNEECAGTFHWQTRRFIGAQTQWEAKNEKRDDITGRRADSLGRKLNGKLKMRKGTIFHWGANSKLKSQF